MRSKRIIYIIQRKNGTLCAEPYHAGFEPIFSLITISRQPGPGRRYRSTVTDKVERDTLQPILELLGAKLTLLKRDARTEVTVRIQNHDGKLHHGDAAIFTRFMLQQLVS